jgi:hypothetical protein
MKDEPETVERVRAYKVELEITVAQWGMKNGISDLKLQHITTLKDDTRPTRYFWNAAKKNGPGWTSHKRGQEAPRWLSKLGKDMKHLLWDDDPTKRGRDIPKDATPPPRKREAGPKLTDIDDLLK